MSLQHPIREASQMRKALEWEPISDEWRTGLIRGQTWWAKEVTPTFESVDSIAANPTEACQMRKMLTLRDKLLSFGGDEVCMPLIEEDYDAIMDRGELFLASGCKYRKGRPSQCHFNSALLWDANRGQCQIATGYALSQDGCWRQHSWVVQPLTVKYRVWETTVRRIAYFGFVLTDTECERFYYENG